MQNEGWNKWEVIYSWTADDGSEFLSEEEYQAFIAGKKASAQSIFLKDGRVLSTYCVLVRRNPYYATPEERKKMEIATMQKEEFLALPADKRQEYAAKTWGISSRVYQKLYGTKSD